MKLVTIIIIVAIIFAAWCMWKKESRRGEDQRSHFGDDDQSYALAALEDLDKGMLENRIPEVNTYYLSQNADDIHLIKEREQDAAAANGVASSNENKIEGMSFNHPINTEYWPYYYYSTPYQYRDGGAWPPGMHSRLYNWQPGFGTSGWSYWLRPGITYDRWPRSRWVKQNDKYYFINNGNEQDRLRDFTGEPS